MLTANFLLKGKFMLSFRLYKHFCVLATNNPVLLPSLSQESKQPPPEMDCCLKHPNIIVFGNKTMGI